MPSRLLMLLLLVPSLAWAASYTLTWEQEPGLIADSTRIERAPATGNACGAFVEIASVAPTQASLIDQTAPAGIVCYRARNVSDLAGSSPYSNVAAAPRPTPPKNVRAEKTP